METKTQALSLSLINKTKEINNYCDIFFEQTLKQALDKYKKTQTLLPFTFKAVYGTGVKRNYSQIEMVDLIPDEPTFKLLKEQNYYYGVPMMCCCFYGMFRLDLYNENLKIMQHHIVMLITMETPLKTARQVYEMFTIDGTKKLVLDAHLSAYARLPANIDKFNHILDSPNAITQN